MKFIVGLLIVASSVTSFAQDPKPVRIFLLAGQSNMEGQGVVDLDHEKYYNGGRGILKTVMKQSPKRYAHIVDADGNWIKRNDVFCRFQARHGLMAGPLTIGFTGYEGNHHIGPEFQFGHVVGKRFEEPILLIKTAWGGKSLFKDFRPPSSGGETGPYYKQMLSEIRAGLKNLNTEFPDLKERKYSIAGFVWMQGWNDMVNKEATAQYEINLVNLINDVRKEFKNPNLPVVVGELGNGGIENVSAGMKTFRAAQKAACSSKHFQTNVTFVPTAKFARPAKESPNIGHGHHWYGNAESYFLVGDALAKAMVKLIDQ